MHLSAEEIQVRQNEVLMAMGRIRRMRRGTLTHQTYPERAVRKEGKGAVGPYGLWQGTVAGKRFGRRVSGDTARAIEAGIAQRHAFDALADEYVALSCSLAELEQGEAPTAAEAVKKGLKPRSKRAKK